MQQHNSALQEIAAILKTPSETQAEEWRLMAEELRRREVYDESIELFLKALNANRLDYQIYIGLAETYLRIRQFDNARAYFEKSLPHGKTENRGYTAKKLELDRY
jgi:tetratricopeptide (TPR) repeat protein